MDRGGGRGWRHWGVGKEDEGMVMKEDGKIGNGD